MGTTETPIVTFYSYKGGVGRSMAVANVAYLLAYKYGYRVLVIDWDLEAPGIHRFFDVPQSEVRTGLINLLCDYKELLKGDPTAIPSEKLFVLKNYVTPVLSPDVHVPNENGRISILCAGRQDKEYARKVNEFNWEDFYANWNGFGFMEYLKKELQENDDIDIVLLDSRTGITDIGGICTLQMPDLVVMLFALNEQNIDGIQTVIEGVLSQATEATGRSVPPKLLLRPARVEKYLEQDQKNFWENQAAERLKHYLPPSERRSALKFFKKRGIPYIGGYGFGETPLAVEKDPDADLGESLEDLTRTILVETGLGTIEQFGQTETVAPDVSAANATSFAHDVIGPSDKGDYQIAPLTHAAEFESKAPEFAAILKTSRVGFAAKDYEDKDQKAMEAKEEFNRIFSRSNLAVFLTSLMIVLFLAVGILNPGQKILFLIFGLLSFMSGSIASYYLNVLKQGKLLDNWMSSRARAETARLNYFLTVAKTPNAGGGNTIELIKLEYFRRFQLDVQLNFYGGASKRHLIEARKTLSWSSFAVAGAGTITALAAFSSAFFDLRFAAVAALGTLFAALNTYVTTRQDVFQNQRNADTYARTEEALIEIYKRIDDVRVAVFADGPKPLLNFIDAVNEQLLVEHKQWLDLETDAENAFTKLQESLNQTLKRLPSSQTAKGGS
jgi:cellulose biosynthesis protein BcsQ